MNTKDLAEKVLERSGLNMTKKDAKVFVDALADVVIEAIADHEPVSISRFGSFKPVVVSSRTARNPRTGEAVVIPERNAVKFSASKAFKDAINGK